MDLKIYFCCIIYEITKVNSKKYLHIISFNVPLPADYGGVIGVFYHLKALHQLGVKIILHCFQYGRKGAVDLEKYCDQVYYYRRDMSLSQLISPMPFIVKTRRNPKLLERLLKDDYPILFEGTHVCYFLSHPALKSRTKIVRMHNVEWQYYENMVAIEKGIKEKMYFKWEANKLKKYELDIVRKYANYILGVSPQDVLYFKENQFSNVHYVSAFHPNESVEILEGKGNFILFHGDLSVKENASIALELVQKIFAFKTHFKLIIAGRKPSDELISVVEQYPNIELKNDVSNEEMKWLIQNAHIHLLRAYQPAGMKLKLLNALYQGRFIIVNSPMVMNTGLDELCIIVEDLENVVSYLEQYMNKEFSELEIKNRIKRLDNTFSNIEKAKITYSLI